MHQLIDIFINTILVCILLADYRCYEKTEFEMDLIRCFLATLLLVFSGQSLALFMPEGFTVTSDAAAESDGGCGSRTIELWEFGES